MLFRLPLVELIPLALVFGVVAGWTASRSGRSAPLWFTLGLLLGLVPLFLFVMPPAEREEDAQHPDALPPGGEDPKQLYAPRAGTVFCARCGCPNGEAATFCNNCGNLIRV